MAATKDRILDVALRLFARDGYEATSTSAIAGELGMTKGALYKHFPSKQAIFDSLVEQMLEKHRATVLKSGGAAGAIANAARAYATASPESMAALGETLFRHWVEDESAVAFRRTLSIERFHNERAAAAYDEFFVNGPLAHHEALFGQMVEIGALDGDPAQMALDFWAPVPLLMQAVDGNMVCEEAVARIRSHILAFAEKYVADPQKPNRTDTATAGKDNDHA